MERGWFEKPVPVAFPSKPGVTYEVSSVFQAVDILLNKWPVEWGPAHLEARQACMAAMEGAVAPGEARDAFITAAEETGILVP